MNITADTTYLHIGSRSVKRSNIKMIDYDDKFVYIMVSDQRSARYGDENSILIALTDTVNLVTYSTPALLKSAILSLFDGELLHVLEDYDISDGGTSVEVPIPGNCKYAIQAVWADVTGTNNATIKAAQSLDGTNYDQLKTINASGDEVDFGITMSGASGSAQIEDREGFTGRKLKLTFAEGTATGGTLNVYVNILK